RSGFAQRIFSEAGADFVPCLRSPRCAASASLKILCLIVLNVWVLEFVVCNVYLNCEEANQVNSTVYFARNK
ncbi:hypothetical protein, partial [Paraburkholderia ultramafica]|uniref:hypothetical protein n=1 Tax=Paraburkholderia ultramafica TaxID=1544867 RepID=UPI001C2E2D2E